MVVGVSHVGQCGSAATSQGWRCVRPRHRGSPAGPPGGSLRACRDETPRPGEGRAFRCAGEWSSVDGQFISRSTAAPAIEGDAGNAHSDAVPWQLWALRCFPFVVADAWTRHSTAQRVLMSCMRLYPRMRDITLGLRWPSHFLGTGTLGLGIHVRGLWISIRVPEVRFIK